MEEYIGKSRGVCAAINTELGVVPPASDTAVYSITAQKALASHVGEGNLGPCRLPLTSAYHLPPPACPATPVQSSVRTQDPHCLSTASESG